jgi:hypothetical protein
MRWALALVLAVGCAATPPRPVSPESPLAAIELGMGVNEVKSILGTPTDVSHGLTPKVFIPFYMGGDGAEVVMHYKGLGRVVLGLGVARPTAAVIRVEEDASEPGFYRSR